MKKWWQISSLISVVSIVILASLWAQMNTYYVKPTQLDNKDAADSYLQEHRVSKLNEYGYEDQPMIKVKTGIFV